MQHRILALVVGLAAIAGGLATSTASAAAPPPLRFGDPYATRGNTLDIYADGCDGAAAIYLYSGSGPTRTIAGYAEAYPDEVTLMYVPWWIPAGVDLTVEGSCLASDGGSVVFDYPAATVELRPDASDPVAVSGTLSPTQVMAGQRVGYTGGPCSILSVDALSLSSMLLVFSGDDPADPGIPTLVAVGPVENGEVQAEGVVFGSDIEPGKHLVLPLCSNLEAWQALPYDELTVTANPAAATIRAEATENGTVTVSGDGCTSGDVALFIEAIEISELDAAPTRSRRQLLDTGEPTATVTPQEPGGSWTYTWPGPAPLDGIVLVTAVCGDLNADGWAYDQVVLELRSASETSTTTTTAVVTTTAPATPATGAQPVRATPTYTG